MAQSVGIMQGDDLVDCTVHQADDHRLSVSISAAFITCGWMNALRRAIMVHVHVVALDVVDVYHNTSTLFDEYVRHRITLVPLAIKRLAALDGMLTRDECTCPHRRCTRCSVRFELNVMNTTDAPMEVTTADLTCDSAQSYDGGDWLHVDPYSTPDDPDAPPHRWPTTLFVLSRNECVHVAVYAFKGTALEDVRWQPAAMLAIKPLTAWQLDRVRLPKELSVLHYIASSCPWPGALRVETTNEKSHQLVHNAHECRLCGKCIIAARQMGAPVGTITIDDATCHAYALSFESLGMMHPAELVVRALRVLQQRVRRMAIDVQRLRDEHQPVVDITAAAANRDHGTL